MAPFKLTKANDMMDTLNYLASFGISSLAIAPILFILYLLHLIFQQVEDAKDVVKMSLRVSVFPGICSGILWSIGRLFIVYST